MVSELRSHCVGLAVQLPGSDALNIWGVYMLCLTVRREAVNAYLSKHLKEGGKHILAGDWNATLLNTDHKASWDEQCENDVHFGVSEDCTQI